MKQNKPIEAIEVMVEDHHVQLIEIWKRLDDITEDIRETSFLTKTIVENYSNFSQKVSDKLDSLSERFENLRPGEEQYKLFFQIEAMKKTQKYIWIALVAVATPEAITYLIELTKLLPQ